MNSLIYLLRVNQYLLIQKSGGALIVAPLMPKLFGKMHSSPFWKGNLENDNEQI